MSPRLVFGFVLFGPGRAWVDDAALDITSILHDEKPEPPRPLTGRGIENLSAFAKLYGYVRYFHPSDQASATDWETFVMEGVRKVERAVSDEELAARLREFFAPVAPTVQSYLQGRTPPASILETGPKIVRYQKTSYDGPNAGVKSESAAGKEQPAVFGAKLAPGILARVPLAVYADDGGTLPHAPAPVQQLYYLTAENRAARLAGVIIAWNLLQHFYPYFDVVKTDWPKALSTALESAATDKSGLAFLSTLRRMIAALHDGHGRVTWEKSPLVPSPVGWDWVENHLVITDVPEPRGQAIERGDIVVAINGKPVSTVLSEAEAEISAATPQWRLARALGTGLHYGNQTLGAIGEGPASEPLVLDIQPFRQPVVRRTVTLERRVSRTPVREPRPDPVSELKPGVIYVDLARISDKDWQASLPRLEEASGLILDIRGYPATLSPDFLCYFSRTLMTSAQWYPADVISPDHDMKFRKADWKLTPREPYLKASKVFLTDGRAISYSETIMGIVEYYQLGQIVGGPTAGTNGNTYSFKVPGGYSVTFTALKVLKHDGSQHHGVGISPTSAATRTLAGVAAGRDEILERGLELLK